MDTQELIQVSFQLPASALDSLSRLAEQLRKLAAAVSGPVQPADTAEELAESGAFDPERFQALLRRAKETDGQPSQAEALAVRGEVTDHVREPGTAGSTLSEELQMPERTAPFSGNDAERLEVDVQSADGMREAFETDIPAVRLELEEQPPDAPVVQTEPEHPIPETEDTLTAAAEGELPLPVTQAADLTGVEMPLGAGLVITTQPEPPASRWTNVTEELVTPGPAPLTAEAVSLAFQRDGRRYDNGFPLY